MLRCFVEGLAKNQSARRKSLPTYLPRHSLSSSKSFSFLSQCKRCDRLPSISTINLVKKLTDDVVTLSPTTTFTSILTRRNTYQKYGAAHHLSIRSLSVQVSAPNPSPVPPLFSSKEENISSVVPRLPRGVKLKPRVVNKRLSKLKTYIGNEKDIRHSPWRLNLVCQFAAGLPVQEALIQLQFCHKVKAPLVAYVIKRTANLAEIRDGLKVSQLEVAECFANHGTHLKRIKFMGRGRAGTKRRRHSNIRVVLREIDFDLKILQAKSMKKKQQWLAKKKVAEEESRKSLIEKEELEELEKARAERAKKETK